MSCVEPGKDVIGAGISTDLGGMRTFCGFAVRVVLLRSVFRLFES